MDVLLKAMHFATARHAGQLRKDNITPFISHPLSVSIILSNYTKNKDLLAAAVLHDVLEDTDTSYSELEDAFGKKISEIVKECSESNKSLSWEARKKETFQKIRTLSTSAAKVKLADILHNMYETVEQGKVKMPMNLPMEKSASVQMPLSRISKVSRKL
jgi:(p)ppGpp synthase/HD superfamily hydrolase